MPNFDQDTINALVLLYLAVSVGRVLFYIPQFLAIKRCPNRASSSSVLSSAYFSFSFWVSTFYFVWLHPDFWAALVAGGNAVGMSIITAAIVWKRQPQHAAFEDTRPDNLAMDIQPTS
jgi:hypothetical protein